jgi:superfamily II DNA or RNA helicase
MIVLRPKQQEAYNKWIMNGGVGTIKAYTAMGKTFVALYAIQQNPDSIFILVPTIALQDQWKAHIDKMGLECGLVGNGQNDTSKPITIAVINSARDMIIKCRLLIIDEVHRIFSSENIKALKNASFVNILALSATPEREMNFIYDKFIAKVPIIFEYELEDAIDDGAAPAPEKEVVICDLTPDEQKVYDEHTATIKEVMPMYGNDIRILMMAIKRGGTGRAVDAARAMTGRRQILAKSEAKILKTKELIESMPNRKIIVFSESIDSIETLGIKLNKTPDIVRLIYLYHSKIKKKERQAVLGFFAKSVNGIILCSRAIDEGVSVDDCDTAIIMSGSSSKRQQIQRIGRILRSKEGKMPKLFELIIKNSVEWKWYKKRKTK